LYDDAGAAMDWLIRVFGFTERARDRQSNGAVRHGELLTANGGVPDTWTAGCDAAKDARHGSTG
jgi:hypothetical protein